MKKWLRFIPAALLLVLVAPLAARAADLDSLVAKLGGDDEIARSEARQYLAREGAAAVPKVLPLLSSPNDQVWNAANNVLTDLANEVSAPGRAKERELVANELMSLVAPSQPADIKIRGLRLLTLVMPEGHTVAPVAALLSDADLKDKARSALQEMATDKSCQALVKALPKADPDFQFALLNSLAFMHNAKSVSSAASYTKSKEPKVRAAAARAVAWTGDPAYAKAITAVYASATPDTAFDAGDALIRYADAVALKGDLKTATGLYKSALGAKEFPIQSAALVGLVRHGDDTAAAAILNTLKGAGARDLEPVVLSGFENASGPNVTKTLLTVYPQISREARVGLVGVMGQKKDAELLEALSAASKDADPTIRRTAYVALADSQLPGGVNALVTAATTASPDDKILAVAELKRLSGTLEASGQGDAAGGAFLGLYRAATTDDVRRYAVAGMAHHPTKESSEALMKAIEAGELKDVPATVLASLAKSLYEAKRTAEGDRLMSQLMAKATTPAAIQEVIAAAQSTKAVTDLGHKLGFVTSWKIAGPFPWNRAEAFKVVNVGEPAVNLAATYKAGGKDIAWKKFETKDNSGIVDLVAVTGGTANVTGYATTTITVAADTDAVARMGSDDGIKLWVNGAAVHENNADRGTQIDQDKAPIKLKAGVNTLLVEVTQGGGGWNFCLRLTNKDGAPLAFDSEK
jgi:hypothetical protein